MAAFSKKSPAEINESWTMAGKNPVNEVPYLGPSLFSSQSACLGSSLAYHFLAVGALGRTLTSLSLSLCISYIQIVVRIKLDHAY